MTRSRSTHLSRVAAARTAVVLVGATGALGAALAIGANTATDSGSSVWIPETGDDTGQYRAPEEDRDQEGDDEGNRALSRTPAHVSAARPGPQHAQSNGS